MLADFLKVRWRWAYLLVSCAPLIALTVTVLQDGFNPRFFVQDSLFFLVSLAYCLLVGITIYLKHIKRTPIHTLITRRIYRVWRFLVPTKRQFTAWSMPSRVTYLSFVLAIVGFAISIYQLSLVERLFDRARLYWNSAACPNELTRYTGNDPFFGPMLSLEIKAQQTMGQIDKGALDYLIRYANIEKGYDVVEKLDLLPKISSGLEEVFGEISRRYKTDVNYQDHWCMSYQVVAPSILGLKPDRFEAFVKTNVDGELATKYPYAVRAISTSESMGSTEKVEWVRRLERMDEQQVSRLMEILFIERQRLRKFD